MDIVLPDTELFEGIDAADRALLLNCLEARAERFCRGEVILPEGEPAGSLGLVLSGMALISHVDVWGNESVLGHAGPGSVFAEIYACVPGEPLLISVTAAEDTNVLFLNAGKLLSGCGRDCGFHSRLTRNLLSVCAQKNLQLSRKILHTSPKTIRGRLMSYFSDCARRSGSGSFVLPYKRQQLADYLGVDRSAMCSELSKMRRDGLIDFNKNRISLNF